MIKADGTLAANGFDALAQFDSSGDGAVNALDSNFGQLKLWQDSNSDAVTDSGELLSLAELVITDISDATQTTSINNGNAIALQSSYIDAQGQELTVADVWFDVQEQDSILPLEDVQLVELSDPDEVVTDGQLSDVLLDIDDNLMEHYLDENFADQPEFVADVELSSGDVQVLQTPVFNSLFDSANEALLTGTNVVSLDDHAEPLISQLGIEQNLG